MRSSYPFLLLFAALAPVTASTRQAGGTPEPRSAPIADVRYEVTFDSTTARRRTLSVAMSFEVTGPGPVLLSLPAWTPGAYEIGNFAQDVSSFAATSGQRALRWDKLDHDTWRIHPDGARSIRVTFDFLADSLDNAMAWARPDFAFFNGTNVFLYPEGRPLEFPATVTIRTHPDWLVATGMHPAGAPRTYRERSFHDLVDMPFFVGRIDLDSMQVDGRWTRLATYPAGVLTGPSRDSLWSQIRAMMPVMHAVFGETPWDHYTTLLVFDSAMPGGSALEHQNSHLGIYHPQFIGSPILASITAHEIFHAWNVKRMRPADLVPYRYDRPQPTPWLWVSEGITDYYADLALVRAGIVDSAAFLATTEGKIENVASLPPVALEDASLSTWIQPTDGTAYVYYPKGSLAGLMLDIYIRNASDNRQSLDDVMRSVYRSTFKAGRGFVGTDWWGAVSRASGGPSFGTFGMSYVDGREPYPWSEVLPLAGLRYVVDTTRVPQLGVATEVDSIGVRVTDIVPGSAAEAAGVRPGDYMMSVGELRFASGFGAAFRERYASREGEPLPIEISRDGRRMTLQGTVKLVTLTDPRIEFDPAASGKALRIRNGILRGRTDR